MATTGDSKIATSVGGSAAAAGEVFRADVATRIAIHLLAQTPIWNPSTVDSVPIALRCEAATKIDDIAVTTMVGRILIQAKGNAKLNVPRDATLLTSEDPFVSAIEQLVAQQKTDPLDAAKDRFVLAYKEATEELKRLKRIGERVVRLDVSTDETQGRVEVLRTEEEQKTFRRFELVLQHITGSAPSWTDLVSLLRLAHFWGLPEGVTHRIDIDPGNLMRVVLADGESCNTAIDALSREVLSLAAAATGTDLSSLREYLGKSFRLEAVPDCARDVERLRATSASHLAAMRRWQRPPFGVTVDRGVVPELVAAMNNGPVVVLGDRGVGKSSTALAVVDHLVALRHQVVVCDLKQTTTSLFTLPGDQPLRNPLERVLAAFPHPVPAYLVLDGLEEIAGQRDLEKSLLALLTRVSRMPGHWRIVGFARPSTLRGRRELQELFFGRPIRSHGDQEAFKKLHHLHLGPLTANQIHQVLSSAPESVRRAASTPAAQAFLAIPETLAMFADVTPSSDCQPLYASPVLHEYWTTRVGDMTRQQVLIQLARAQRRYGSSTIPIHVLLADGVSAQVIERLLDDGVIVLSNERVGFSHEMVADFIHARFPGA